MAKYPVSAADQNGLAEAVNYLLSGPQGLGQNFAGFSAYRDGWITGNFRLPYSTTTTARLYVAPIALSKSEMLDGRTFKFTFETPQAEPPFKNGNGIETYGIEDSWYNDTYATIGVVDCTVDYAVVRTTGTYDVYGPSSGGYIFLQTGSGDLSTDANCRVTVNSATDRVFISAQLDNLITYTATGTDTLTYTVSVNRYYGEPNTDSENTDYYFIFDETVAQKIYTITNLSGTGTTPLQETVFATILDEPDPGYYWYILEVSFVWTNDLGQVTESKTNLRSITAQVVKE